MTLSGGSHAPIERADDATNAPNPYAGVVIVASCGGGVTGGVGGVLIAPDNRVTRWSQITPAAERVEADVAVDEAFAASVRHDLEAIGFGAIQFSRPGNMTCALRAGDHAVAWPMDDPRAPASVAAVHGRMMAVAGP